jgi:hypothetical protein
MFKRFLMENAHRENVKNLFRWWNGHVFSFESVPGTSRKDDDGFDSGMEAAVAALNSDEEFSGGGGDDFGDEDFGGDNNHFYPPALPSNTDTDLSTNLMQLTISERSAVPSNPAAAPKPPIYAIAVPRVRDSEPTLGDSDGTLPNMDDAQNVRFFFQSFPILIYPIHFHRILLIRQLGVLVQAMVQTTPLKISLTPGTCFR